MQTLSKKGPADRKKTATIKALLELAVERNPNDITTSAIAATMGLRQSALFRRFLSKDVILEASMEWAADSLLTRVDSAIHDAPSPLDALESIFMTHIDFISCDPGVPRMLLAELQRPGMTPAKRIAQNLLKQYEERLCNLIETGKLFGQLDQALPTAAAAQLFISAVQGLVIQTLLTETPHKAQADAAGIFALYRHSLEKWS
jgi:AcrR family transcriptional regulator